MKNASAFLFFYCLKFLILLNEQLFFYSAFSVEIWAHEHSYERLFPIYNYTVLNGSIEEPYTNPRAPVHIGKFKFYDLILLLKI